MSSTRPSSARQERPEEDPELGPVQVDEDRRRARGSRRRSRGRRCAGPGRLWTRGRSVLSSTAADARRQPRRQRRQHQDDARPRTRNPQSATPSSTSAREGVREGHGAIIAKAQEGLDDPRCGTSERLLDRSLVTKSSPEQTFDERIANARGEDRHRRPRLRRAAARDGVRGDRLRGHRHRPGRGARARDPRSGRSYLVDVPAERYGRLDGRLTATTDYAAVAELDALTICVPTPLSKTRTPDLSYIVSAAESVAANLRPGQLVVLQSTTYPGTTEEIVLPILEAGGEVGRDFFLGYAPERVDPGNAEWTIKNTPKLVAGVTTECRRRTELLYAADRRHDRPRLEPHASRRRRRSTRTPSAPSTSRSRTSWRSCATSSGSPPWEVIEAAATKPFAFLPHYPGPGLGGDCIPIVPHFLAWRLREYGYSRAADRGGARDQRAHADLRRPEGRATR